MVGEGIGLMSLGEDDKSSSEDARLVKAKRYKQPSQETEENPPLIV